MAGLISSLSPRLREEVYAFCTVDGGIADYAALDPVATVKEDEGLTLILPAAVARREGFSFECTFRCITLMVHSSLESVGLTAAVSSELAAYGIPANIVAGDYHDHVFVPGDRAAEALELLEAMAGNGN